MSQRVDQKKIVSLGRDVMAMMVPSGARIMLHQGTEVTITQALGNAFTVNVFGNLASINHKDADALGCTPQDPLADLPQDAEIDARVMALLKTVYDPEIPVNIVDLGLIYRCDIHPIAGDQYDVTIAMTLTAPGCGMGPAIAADVHDQVTSLPEINQVNVDMVFDPPWNRDMMSALARLELGML